MKREINAYRLIRTKKNRVAIKIKTDNPPPIPPASNPTGIPAKRKRLSQKQMHMFKSNEQRKKFLETFIALFTVYFILGILRTDLWSQGRLAMNSKLKDGAFTSVKRNVAFLTRNVKRVPFTNRRYTEEVKELDLGAEPLRIKLC